MHWLARSKREQNRAAIDPWTAVHLAAGLAAGLVDLPLGRAVVLAGGYEVVEQVVERRGYGQRFFATYGPESPANVALDLAAFVLGHRLGRRWNRTGRGGAEGGPGRSAPASHPAR